MDFRRIAILTAAAAVFLPALSHADSQDKALNACARAFATKISALGSDPQYRVTLPPLVSSPVTDYYAREFTFTMTARGVKSGAPLGEATCSATTQGRILAISFKPATGEATLASR
jgi:hypothetical protein